MGINHTLGTLSELSAACLENADVILSTCFLFKCINFGDALIQSVLEIKECFIIYYAVCVFVTKYK